MEEKCAQCGDTDEFGLIKCCVCRRDFCGSCTYERRGVYFCAEHFEQGSNIAEVEREKRALKD